MRIRNYVIELSFNALNKFTHVRLHRYRENRWRGPIMYRHFCWWKMSLIYGQPHLMPIVVCKECSEEISGVQYGEDDSLHYCEYCQQVEGDVEEITMEEYEARHG